MIALIVSILVFILGIFLIICGIIGDENQPFIIGFTGLIIMCIILLISLNFGKSIYKQDNTKSIAKKEQIEYLLENNISSYVIEQAQKYNEEIDAGNNYWCRFSIEDRSEFKIDIDKYLNKEN